MSILKELGISELGDNLRGLTSSTKMHYKNFDIKCGNSETDQMLAGYGDDKERCSFRLHFNMHFDIFILCHQNKRVVFD